MSNFSPFGQEHKQNNNEINELSRTKECKVLQYVVVLF